MDIGIYVALDPPSAIGVAIGEYPAGVGVAALAVGPAVVWLGESDDRPLKVVLAGSIGGALIGFLAAVVPLSHPLLLTIQLGLAGASSGFAAVRGAATEQTGKRLGKVSLSFRWFRLSDHNYSGE